MVAPPEAIATQPKQDPQHALEVPPPGIGHRLDMSPKSQHLKSHIEKRIIIIGNFP